jgi:hypothetical protein
MMFTVENTNGYTQSECDTLNLALDELLSSYYGGDRRDELEGNASDFVHNAYEPGMSADEIVSKVRSWGYFPAAAA